MKNGRRNNSSKERGNTTIANVTRNDDSAIGGIRTNDESIREQSNGNDGSEISIEQSLRSDNTTESRNSDLEITDGFYFTPRGIIERIPDGHYIGNDGRLRKRRKRNSSNTDDGNENRNRTETSNESELDSESYLREKPLNVRTGKRGRKAKESDASQRLTMVTMLTMACSALFTSIALFTKHDHWSLEQLEAKHLATALNDAFATLPEKYYAQILAVAEKWVPWVQLVFVASAIILTRIEESAKLIEAKHSNQDQTSNAGNARTKTHSYAGNSSLGWNGR